VTWGVLVQPSRHSPLPHCLAPLPRRYRHQHDLHFAKKDLPGSGALRHRHFEDPKPARPHHLVVLWTHLYCLRMVADYSLQAPLNQQRQVLVLASLQCSHPASLLAPVVPRARRPCQCAGRLCMVRRQYPHPLSACRPARPV
jgi:hypothetical protein